jgi:FtsP/CotA-like multicopper oxidase with cupredoxin domain
MIQPNGQTQAAGILRNGTLTVALETRLGRWQPEGPNGGAIDSVIAFAEVNGEASTPGPLIRVPVGTRVRGTLHNTLSRPLTLFGLGRTRQWSDSLVVGAGVTAPFEFTAGEPGTFFYFARTHPDTILGRDPKEMQLNGAIVIDRPGAPADRVLGISWYFTIDPKSANGVGQATMAINGLSWPHTEHLTYNQGDSVRWRVINFTEADHPMHLHGIFFRVDARGADGVDTVYTPSQQRMAVTEVIPPFQSTDIAWKADRPGNWVFHCHYAVHVSDYVSLDSHLGVLDSANLQHHLSSGPHQMFGLVMGITVAPRGVQALAAPPERRIRLVQREKPNVYGGQPGLSYLVDDSAGGYDSDAMPVPAPALILERGKRVEVTIVNQSSQHAAVHWHGIELESYPDGVPGWSGSGTDLLPSIAPHDSLSVQWTPPRAGSYMYHSHFNEMRQMGGGLYGPIIVLEPGQHYDRERDRILFFGSAGAILSFLEAPPAVLLNGSTNPAPMDFTAGTTYRLRLFNLAGDTPTFVTLTRNGQPATWRGVAKDGYPLPPVQATLRPAVLTFDPGEIYDFEFTPPVAGEYTLAFGFPQPPPPGQAPPLVNVAVHVH